MDLSRVLAGEKRQRFFRYVRASYELPDCELIRIAKSDRLYSAAFRAAALMNLVGNAPLAVTKGRPYAERRRLCRVHYGI